MWAKETLQISKKETANKIEIYNLSNPFPKYKTGWWQICIFIYITPEINGRKTYPDKIINHYKHQEEYKFIERNGKLKNLRERNDYEDNVKYIKNLI